MLECFSSFQHRSILDLVCAGPLSARRARDAPVTGCCVPSIALPTISDSENLHMMYCLRSYLPLLLLPLPLSLSPVHLVLFIALTYFLNRPCIYCSLLLVILFASSCQWSNRCFIDLRQHGEDTSSVASWFIPRLYTTPATALAEQTNNSSDMGAFLVDIANSTVAGLSQALKESASGLLEGEHQKLTTTSLPSSLPTDVGIGTHWLRHAIGRSEWTLPCVGVKVVL